MSSLKKWRNIQGVEVKFVFNLERALLVIKKTERLHIFLHTFNKWIPSFAFANWQIAFWYAAFLSDAF